ncbi:TRP-domain-containing protein [Daldinia caldariorum]|uniref:TRP-domain-containing protein n=1 Tax=Daldinia caldariorum TaxID=326644 RepID=UPI002008433A|nr:TRP-domain-containing protein [Daldinia caldariorum]KAI1466955.1 TRP-domain-containing protein [Daldinia caldariorum]
MWFSNRSPLLAALYFASAILPVESKRILQSTSLNICQENSGFTASLFSVVFNPDTNKASVNITALSTIEAKVEFDVDISAYGYRFEHIVVKPCDLGLAGFCPMVSGKLGNPFDIDVPDAASQIPSIAYDFPDIDAKVRIRINATDGPQAGQTVACVEALVSNGQTVDLIGVKWASAVVAGLALASSAFLSGLGHTNAASHVAANALSLVGYFQAQAMVGLMGIPLPPVVQAWTQDFQWSMGIIEVPFMQRIFTWYQRSTGGTASNIIDQSDHSIVSVEVQKRAVDLFKRGAAMLPNSVVEHGSKLMKRANVMTSYGSYVVYGIQRVAFRADIETTNLFLTAITFFYLIMVVTTLCVVAFKGICELAAKQKWIKGDTFLDFRNGWRTVLKGILFRMALIGHPPVTILCLWEFTQNDSSALMVVAVFFLVAVNGVLAWAAYKVVRIAHRSVALHRNPAYILFSDPQTLNKWGFLYIQFRASAYYFIIPVLSYTVVKAFFIAFAQNSGIVQAIAFLIIEAAALISSAVLRPWMDKKTNSFNIAIAVVNFLNAIFLLIFTKVFDQPGLVTGVVGVVLWILNAVCTLVLLLMLIITTGIVIFQSNPDGRYKFMSDDRTSFMKSQSQLATSTELDALGVTARGEKPGYSSGLDLDDDEDSNPRNSSFQGQSSRANSTANNSHHAPSHFAAPHSPIDPINRTSSPYNGSVSSVSRSQHSSSPAGIKPSASPSPWQRGAGYDH